MALGAAAAGTLAIATPAAADVTVTPAESRQGDAAKLTFKVSDDPVHGPATKVAVEIPAATPIAEVYPMSVPDWAPGMTMRTIDQPVTPIEHGAPTTEVVSVVTWTRVPGAPADPAHPGELTLSLGPMPSVDRMTFEVTETFADGFVEKTSLPLPLLPALPVTHDNAPVFDTPAAQPEDSGGVSGATVGLASFLLLGALAVGGLAVRSVRRRSATTLKPSPSAGNNSPRQRPVAPPAPKRPGRVKRSRRVRRIRRAELDTRVDA